MKVGDQPFNGFQTGISGKAGLVKERPQLRIMKVPDGAAASAGEVVFQAWYIPMTHMGDGRGGGGLAHHVMLSGSDGPNIALTSQMSGCTLGIGSTAPDGSRFVAHIRPPSGPPSTETYANMRNDAQSRHHGHVLRSSFEAGDPVLRQPPKPCDHHRRPPR